MGSGLDVTCIPGAVGQAILHKTHESLSIVLTLINVDRVFLDPVSSI